MVRPVNPQTRAASAWRIGATLTVAGLLAAVAPAVQAVQAQPGPAPGVHGHARAGVSARGAHAAPARAQGHGVAPHGGAEGGTLAAEAGHDQAHGESRWATLARVANFAILAAVLYWFGRGPLVAHLAARRDQIRKDLVDAAEMRQTATARLAEIEHKLQALPGELEQLQLRGAQELEAERTRIRDAAMVERDRLVDQARREIASQTRGATAQLRALAADLAIGVAEARLRDTLTPAEQSTLVDRYASQMGQVQ